MARMIPDVNDHTPFHAAILYVKAGFRVFPLIKGSKEPVRGFEWDRDAWSTEEEVREFWGAREPDAFGIGLPMALNGLVAVDLDHPENAAIDIHRLLNTALATQVSRVDEGRMHFVWQTDQVLGNSGDRFPGRGAGVDIRGVGYLVAAPTTHEVTGEPYYWATRELSALPNEFLPWFSFPGESAKPATEAEVEAFLQRYTDAQADWKLDDRIAAFKEDAAKWSRNNAALSHFGEVFREARAGNYAARDAWSALRDALDTPEAYEDDRAVRLLCLGVAHALAASDQDLDRLRPVVFPTVDNGSSDFWESRRTLTTIHQAAKARLINPYALLGAALVDVIAATPPSIELDTFGGATASLNLFIALCGPSGSGKTMTAEAVRDVISIEDRTNWQNLRSGEGLVSCYVRKKGKDTERISDRAVVEVDEIDRLTALSNRSGATIMPTLRSAWVGATLGGRAATSQVDLSVPHRSYRCCLVAGVQPGRSRALFEDADGGTPQRFVWLPANDPQAELGHEWPTPIQWTIEREASGIFQGSGPWKPKGNLSLPAEVVEEWQQDKLLRARGQGDELDSHKMLATAKIAAGFALLEMHESVTSEDWRLAKHLMRVSDVTRLKLKQELARNAEVEAASRGRMAGIQQATADEVSENAVYLRAVKKVRAFVESGLSKQQISPRLSRSQREYLDAAFEEVTKCEGMNAISPASG